MNVRSDRDFMARALELARRGLYTADPNPRVGCVLVRAGEVVGEGWHRRAGEAHAEAAALEQAGERARGATAYVTLEPCCHQGRTPPCTRSLIDSGVARVVAATVDPDPRVAGQGLAALRSAGITADCGLLEAQAEALNPGFVMRHRAGRPLVRCKLAMTLDGRTAAASGESRWITGEAARRDVQRLRARSSAVMVGIGTVLSDDPALTVRPEVLNPAEAGHSPVEWRQPLRIVLDSRLRLPVDARLLALSGPVLIATAAQDTDKAVALRDAGAEVRRFAGPRGRVDPAALLAYLAGRQVNEVLLEAGAVLSGTMLETGLVDELVIYTAPKLLGDRGRGLFALPAVGGLAEAIRLDIQDIRAVGEDWRIVAKPTRADV